MTQNTIDQLQANAKVNAVKAANVFKDKHGRMPTDAEAKELFREMLEDLALAKMLADQ